MQMCAMCVMCGGKTHVVCGEKAIIPAELRQCQKIARVRRGLEGNQSPKITKRGTEFARREAYVATIGKYPDACGEYRIARLAIA